MNKLQLPQAKLLYAVGEAYRKRMIDETEKRILKEKIITDNVEIYEVLDQSENENALLEKLVTLVRAPQPELNQNEPILSQDNQVPNPAEQQEASSPWGQFLRRKKMKLHHEHKNQVHNIKNLIKPEKAD